MLDPAPERYCPEWHLPDRAHRPGQGQAGPALGAQASHGQGWDGRARALLAEPGYRFGIDLFNRQFYWEAHEVWEGLWMRAAKDSPQRDFLQGLIQCAAALLKASMGQGAGSASLMDKAARKLARVEEAGHTAFAGLDLASLTSNLADYRRSPMQSKPPRISLVHGALATLVP